MRLSELPCTHSIPFAPFAPVSCGRRPPLFGCATFFARRSRPDQEGARAVSWRDTRRVRKPTACPCWHSEQFLARKPPASRQALRLGIIPVLKSPETYMLNPPPCWPRPRTVTGIRGCCNQFDRDRRGAAMSHREFFRSLPRYVDVSTFGVRTAIVNAHRNRTTIVQVRHQSASLER
jgi:hypothetical protein